MNRFTSKIVLLGDAAVGKTSLLQRFVSDKFSPNSMSTIGATFVSYEIDLNDYFLELQIWDTAGQEKYHSLTPMYYRGAKGAIIVYDITNYESFERARNWVQEIKSTGNTTTTILLVGNKIDLGSRVVKQEEAEKFASNEKIYFIETSAKTSNGVQEAFITLSKNISISRQNKSSTFLEISEKEIDVDEVIVDIEKIGPRNSLGCC
ncbi:ras and ef-hand domain-containing protein [Anaeramoeba flamelloides]|uniref:Ras and ef-hand domain-containing protein n=1 Tax=Anaeramoeba flamelloides TaxID=1746091 RepID=A0AAV7YFL1_9EUKA|nr:ras and ef-hand domain-containing protein [Anaeramoeba flamelloides]KAJ6234249.1 ras and ef-hand domain-containing protein [Anaeramoeba flamelloides]